VTANRFQQLTDDFTVYMEKRRGESIVSHFSHMTNATRTGHTRFVEDSPSGKPFHNFYTVGQRLGEGENSYVFRAIRKQTKQSYAVKHTDVASLDKDSKQTLRDEVRALRLLRGGPHIIRLFDIFQQPDNIYMIMEEMKGGNLLSRIVEKEVYTEREARQVCKIAFTAINYCHRKKVAHRDVKPENFLLVDEGDDTSIKLADFAFAKKVTKEKALMTLCGTAQYVAPEILDQNNPGYDHRCDNWSLGVFSFVLLGGYPPFEGVNDDLVTEIRRGVFDFHDEYWSEISLTAKKMISSLLVVDPAKRLTVADALSCEWMAAEEEQLVLRDLSLAQNSIKKHIEPKTKVKMAVQTVRKNWFCLICLL
jgi:calcium/calmodulin-dependent protein kinase I